MSDHRLDIICAQIQAVSGISKPFNYGFKGDVNDENLFAQIVRGKLPQWRIWEDEDHVAFLTPFANTPGFTVLVPRRHLSSDIFAIEKDSLGALLGAAHTVAGILKTAFKIRRCGMIFEGFEIDYAHIKLVPIIDEAPRSDGLSVQPVIHGSTDFHQKYQGYVSSLDGPQVGNFKSLEKEATAIHEMIIDGATCSTNPIQPPRSWASPSQHLSAILHHSWYEKLFQVQDTLFHASVDFFRTNLGYKYGFVPLTTDSVSSPMGLGSDSCPVSVSLFDKDTHLADSMQFALECLLRIQSDVPGVYYVSTSFRGEDPDYMHLNQFSHVECELLGDLNAGIEVAEDFVVSLVSRFLREQRDLIHSVAGNADHLTALLEQKHSHNGAFPRISVDAALALPCMDSSCWEYVTSHPAGGARTLTCKGELALIQHFGGGAVWLTEMDHLSVPFYQAFTDQTHQKARCADLLLGNGEVLGLGERHAAAEDVHAALVMHDVLPEKYAWYLQMRRERKLTTTGWGVGVERFLAWMFKHDDVRDMTLLPRMKGVVLEP